MKEVRECVCIYVSMSAQTLTHTKAGRAKASLLWWISFSCIFDGIFFFFVFVHIFVVLPFCRTKCAEKRRPSMLARTNLCFAYIRIIFVRARKCHTNFFDVFSGRNDRLLRIYKYLCANWTHKNKHRHGWHSNVAHTPQCAPKNLFYTRRVGVIPVIPVFLLFCMFPYC